VTFYHGFHQTDALDRQEIRLIFERGEIKLNGWICSDFHLRASVGPSELRRIEQLLTGIVSPGSPGRLIRSPADPPSPALSDLCWTSLADKDVLYRKAVQARFQDFVQQIHDPGHRPRVTATDGVEAVRLAEHAKRLSKQPLAGGLTSALRPHRMRRSQPVLS
jgi:hypothetical protein